MGLAEQALGNWVKAADAGKLNGAGVKQVAPEERELSLLRAENIRLKREPERLKSVLTNSHFARIERTGGGALQ